MPEPDTGREDASYVTFEMPDLRPDETPGTAELPGPLTPDAQVRPPGRLTIRI